MTARRQLFLEGDRIVDADGKTVADVPPEVRPQLLGIARHSAIMRRLGPPESNPLVARALEAAQRLVERTDPDTLRRAEAGAEARMAEYRRLAQVEVQRLLAEAEREIPDSTTARIALTP